jgi:hypothetical protein
MSDRVPDETVSDHDLLVALGTDMAWLKKCFSNHLAHHARYEVALIIAIILMVVKEVFVN